MLIIYYFFLRLKLKIKIIKEIYNIFIMKVIDG